jgi:hypothetical protein
LRLQKLKGLIIEISGYFFMVRVVFSVLEQEVEGSVY